LTKTIDTGGSIMKAEDIKFKFDSEDDSGKEKDSENPKKTQRGKVERKVDLPNMWFLLGSFGVGFSMGALLVVISEDEDVGNMIGGFYHYGKGVVDDIVRGSGLETEQESDFSNSDNDDAVCDEEVNTAESDNNSETEQ
jgi:hypothetical protein